MFVNYRPEAQHSLKGRKESEKRTRLAKDNLVKPILISYVRAEAAQYALHLKQELVSLGLTVYLVSISLILFKWLKSETNWNFEKNRIFETFVARQDFFNKIYLKFLICIIIVRHWTLLLPNL